MLERSPEAIQRARLRCGRFYLTYCKKAPLDCALTHCDMFDLGALRRALLFSTLVWSEYKQEDKKQPLVGNTNHAERLHGWEQILAQGKKFNVPVPRWMKLHGLMLTASVKCC